jgi:hypothetical protein
MHFVAPLFEQLGYTEDQEAAGFGFVVWEGARQHHAEAGLLYFAGDVHDTEKGDPLVLVETKAPGKGPDAGLGQARSYAFWLKPACYIMTDRLGEYWARPATTEEGSRQSKRVAPSGAGVPG